MTSLTTPSQNLRLQQKRVRMGKIHVDVVSFAGAIDAIVRLIHAKKGGYVVTPNVDHVCLAETDARLEAVYAKASLSLTDGAPLVWLARLMGHPVPQKISGSDLIRPLLARAQEKKLRVFLFGGVEGVAERAKKILVGEMPGLLICGTASPPFGFERDPKLLEVELQKIAAAKPDLLLVALGCPKQEYFMADCAAKLAPAVSIGIGASLDFIAGTVKRAPAWMSRVGLEWVFRLCQEPGRMASRYLVRDRAILGIVMRMLSWPKERRTFSVDP